MSPSDALHAYPGYPLWRYTETDGHYTLSNMAMPRHGVSVQTGHGKCGTQPHWLQTILTVAKLGGHEVPVKNPPPGVIVWFVTDFEGELLTFLEVR